MLKDNRLLIGMGIGLIIGAILLELMNVAITGVAQDDLLPNNTLEENQYSLEQLKEIADTLDYNIIEKSVVLYTQAELDEAVLNARKAVEEKSASAEPSDNIDDQELLDNLVKDASDIYHVTIDKGMITTEVSQLLIRAGLIDDAESFKEEINKTKKNTNIQTGTFVFLEKPSISEIIQKITNEE